MGLKCITLRPVAECPRGFLALPAEIRLRIYREVLVDDKPKWQRHHKHSCSLAPRNKNTLEWPPFLNQDGDFATPEDRCGCTLRDGLGLLRVNRQIHAEAAETFWSQNTFFFAPAAQFADVTKNLRPAYRHLLQHVCILDDLVEPDGDLRHASAQPTAVLKTLLSCTGLRTIELGHTLLAQSGHVALVRRLATLPRLLSLSLAALLSYQVTPAATADARPPYRLRAYVAGYGALPRKSLIWFKAGREINPLRIHNQEDLHVCERDFVTNFLVHLRHEIQMLPQRWSASTAATTTTLPVTPNSPYAAPRSPWSTFLTSPTTPAIMGPFSRSCPLRDGPVTLLLVMRDHSECLAELMGLPLSARTRARHVRARQADVDALHAAGQWTAAEEKARQMVARRRAEKKQAKRNEETAEEEAAMRDRQARRVEAVEARRQAAKEMLQAERAAKAQALREAQETRRAERKRSISPADKGQQSSVVVRKPEAPPRTARKRPLRQPQRGRR